MNRQQLSALNRRFPVLSPWQLSRRRSLEAALPERLTHSALPAGYHDPSPELPPIVGHGILQWAATRSGNTRNRHSRVRLYAGIATVCANGCDIAACDLYVIIGRRKEAHCLGCILVTDIILSPAA